jgi:peptidyl-prolyl cis-trans isomerase D
MAIMGYLRERMGKIVAAVIGLSLFAFIATEAIRSGGSFFKDDNNTIGLVGEEKIPLDEFSKTVEQNTANFKQQSGQAEITPQITSYIQDNAWNQFVSKAIVKKEVDKLGLTVGTDETQSMTSGTNPSPQVVQAFTDPQTGKFDRTSVLNAIGNISRLKDDNPQKIKWMDFVTQLIEAKLAEKYMTMVTNGLYVNSLDAKDSYEGKNKLANFKYTSIDYASIPDSKVTITDADYSSYYDEHKSEFKNQQELRSISYVSINGSPSKDDSTTVKEQVAKLLPEFKSSTNDSLFVQINSETKAPLIYQRKDQLDPKLDTVMFNASPGFIYGPYLSNGSYKLAKLIDSRIGPDSVKARHILIAPEGGMAKAMEKADSIKKLIESGKKTFADMAQMYSFDKGSAAKGGEVGTFGRGAMMPAFEDVAFNGKKGDIKIAITSYGVHIIQIEDQKGSSKVVKVAVVDKPLSASSKTQSAAYSKAQAFLISLNKDNFDQEAQKAGLKVKPADDIVGAASSLPGLESARDMVRWVFKASKGDISDQVFTIGDQYVVAHVTQIKPQGTLSLDIVKKQIEPMVRNQVKGKMLTDKFTAALSGSSSLEQVAQKAGGKAVAPVQNLVFANPIIPGAATEYKVVGTVFGSQPNKISKPIAGQQGVYVFVINNFINPAPLTNAIREKEQIGQALLQRSEGQIFDALKDKDNVKDYRAKLL